MSECVISAPETACSALASQSLDCGIRLEVHAGLSAYGSDLLVSMLCKSKADLFSVEEAQLLADSSQRDEGIAFESPDYAEGLIRISGVALRGAQAHPAALGLAHLEVRAHRGYHQDLGYLLKLHLSVGAGHVHRMGVGLGLHQAMAKEMARQVLEVIKEFQRTCKEDMTIMWTFEESMAACTETQLRRSLHAELLSALYAPLLPITEDWVL